MARPQYLGGGQAQEIAKQLKIMLQNLNLKGIAEDSEVSRFRMSSTLKACNDIY